MPEKMVSDAYPYLTLFECQKKMVYDASPYLTLLECQKKWFLMPTLISPYLNARKKWFMMPPLILPYLNARNKWFLMPTLILPCFNWLKNACCIIRSVFSLFITLYYKVAIIKRSKPSITLRLSTKMPIRFEAVPWLS